MPEGANWMYYETLGISIHFLVRTPACLAAACLKRIARTGLLGKDVWVYDPRQAWEGSLGVKKFGGIDALYIFFLAGVRVRCLPQPYTRDQKEKTRMMKEEVN